MSVDERTLTIIKAMARGPACYDDNSNSICVYCDTEWDHINVAGFREIRHKPECPVLLARTVLKELGTPMNIYQIGSRYASIKREQRQYWRSLKFYTIATTPEEATREASKEYTWIEDMHAEFVQELPIQE
jgi:hypothetical protein